MRSEEAPPLCALSFALLRNVWPGPAVHQARQIEASAQSIQRSGITRPGPRAKGESLKRLIHLLCPGHGPNISGVVVVGQSRGRIERNGK